MQAKEPSRQALLPDSWLNLARVHLELWIAGMKDGLGFHRCVVFCYHDEQIWKLILQTILLNGIVYLGSILLWGFVLEPLLQQLLAISMGPFVSQGAVHLALSFLGTLYTCLWLAPVYLVSFSLSCKWYQEIAALAVQLDKRLHPHQKQAGLRRPAPQGRAVNGLAEELVRVLLFAVFYIQILPISLVPVVGNIVSFVLLSWLYALYSFDYKWSLTAMPLEQRISFFQQHWAFFNGFGSVCVAATSWWSFWAGTAIMATVYPFFILIACPSDPRHIQQQVLKARKVSGLQPLHIFAPAMVTTNWLVCHGPEIVAALGALQRHPRKALACLLAILIAFCGFVVSR